VIAIPRGHPGQVSLHRATLVGLGSLGALPRSVTPDDALTSLERAAPDEAFDNDPVRAIAVERDEP
jgi:hypothetical protein